MHRVLERNLISQHFTGIILWKRVSAESGPEAALTYMGNNLSP